LAAAAAAWQQLGSSTAVAAAAQRRQQQLRRRRQVEALILQKNPLKKLEVTWNLLIAVVAYDNIDIPTYGIFCTIAMLSLFRPKPTVQILKPGG
jgi:hypothetical protein